MNSSKLPSEVSINIVNSSHFSIDALTSVLKAQIASGQRPHVVCLTQEELRQATNLQAFMKKFIEERMTFRRNVLEKSQQIKDFNQLNEWKKEVELRKGKKEKRSSLNGIKDGIRNQSTAMKRDCVQNAIIDFPLENESIKLYLILFDIYDFELIKSLVLLDSSLKAIINLFPREAHNETIPIRNAEFWEKLIEGKSSKTFKDVAFIDLDVPVESHYMVNLRSKLVYDQFSHFFYDIEMIKSRYKAFCERFEMVEINVESAASGDDLDGVKRRLDEIPERFITVDVIYDAILDQIVNDENEAHKSSLKSHFPFQVEVFGKIFTDLNDSYGDVFEESPKFYDEQIQKMEDNVHMWDGVESVSLEKRQLLNHFMEKLLKALRAEGEGFDHLEFYIYALQLSAMEKVSKETSTAKEFYENRNVGRENHPKLIKLSVSDSELDYNNRSKIPAEISKLVSDKEKLQVSKVDQENLKVRLFSPPAMVQLLTQLMDSSKVYTKEHCQLFDVMLIKFHKQSAPKMFSSRTYSKILPTPLCFRDFNDFEKHNYLKTETTEEAFFREGDRDTIQENPLKKAENFILKSSIKHQKKMLEVREKEGVPENEMRKKTQGLNVNGEETGVKRDLCVFNVSDERIQLHLTESEFNSVHLHFKASTFDWLNHLRVLNVSCQMHDLFLSISHDLNANNLQHATLTSSDGMKCSLYTNPIETDGTQHFLSRWNFSISHSNGCAIKNLNAEAVEQYWVEKVKKSPEDEAKRVVFSNGFVMIVFVDGAQKVLSPNGTTFDVMKPKSPQSTKATKNFPTMDHDKEATHLLLDSITSIHFLKQFTDLPTTFKLTLPSGEKFLVEHDLIVEKLETIELRETFNQTTGSLQICRDDGVKILHTEAFTKCLFPDGTLITTWLHDGSIETTADDVEDINEAILDQTTESRNESKFVVHQILNNITDDYFLNINSNHQVEHKDYGAVHFDRMKNVRIENCEMKIQAHSDIFLMTMNDGVTFKIDKTHIRLTSGKCNECVRSNGFSLNFLNESEGGNEVFVTARDFANNTFLIRKNGQHAFHGSETYESQKCQSCENEKRKYEFECYGERGFVVNRDNSGYEITSSIVTGIGKAFFEIQSEVLLFNEPSCHYKISDKDVNIAINPEIKTLSIIEKNYNSPSIEKSESSLASVASPKPLKHSKTTKTRKRKSTKKLSQELEIIQPPIEEGNFPQWLTVNPSISLDISNELRNLIQFYDNPLNELPVVNAVGPMIKLNNKLHNVTDAVQHLKKYSSEKFIYNATGLKQTLVGKKSFQENFKLVVRKTLENHIQQKLECYRNYLADVVINDLMGNAITAAVKARSDVETSCDETNAPQIENSVMSTSPVAVKAFSFS